ncbi:MAG: RNA polymerase sigma factor [Saprospiraceae bacterium]|nr:RNA polymerase sigma factor [Saprospiraceae bacterium]
MNNQLFLQHIYPLRDKMYRFALRITGNVQEAEDVVQEVMERLWKQQPEQSHTVQNWEAWCMTMTRNRSLDKNRRKPSSPIEGVPEPAHTDSPAAYAEKGDMVAHIRRLIQLLPEKQRLVIHLRDLEDMTYDDIARTLDISLEQVKINLYRARRALRQHLLTLVEL